MKTEQTPLLTSPKALPALWPAKLAYFAFNAAQTAGLNFAPLFWQSVTHFSHFQIGVLQTLLAVCAVVAPPLWGWIADRRHVHRLVLQTTILGGAVFLFAAKFTMQFRITVVLAFLSYFHQSAVSALLDHAVLGLLAARGGGDWGRQRLFAAAGWGVGAYCTSALVRVLGLASAFNVNLVLSLLTLLTLYLIPDQDEEDLQEQEQNQALEQDQQQAETEIQQEETVAKQSSSAPVLALLGVVLCMGTMHGAIGVFLPLYVFELSNSDARIVGVVILVQTLSELPAFFFADRILRRIGTTSALLLGVAAFFIRLTFYSIVKHAWYVLPFECLHGLDFSLFWAAATQYIYAAAPPKRRGTWLGLLAAAQFGVGYGMGTMLGGSLWQHYGAVTMWQVLQAFVPIALVGIAVFARIDRKRLVALENDTDAEKKQEA